MAPSDPSRSGGFEPTLLVAWRKLHGLSQRELARRLNCQSSYIVHIEKGRRAPRPQFWEVFHDRCARLLPPGGPRAAFFRAAA